MKLYFLQHFNLLQKAQFAVYSTILVGALIFGFGQNQKEKSLQSEKAVAIEKALYIKTEFFGANAIVPFPTAQARENLSEVLQRFPDDAEILIKLADLDEKLGNFDQAEQEISAVKPENLTALANFYERRAQFEKKAEILEKILATVTEEKLGEAFSTLINFAKKHDLEKYQKPDFFQKIINQNNAAFSVFQQYVEKL
ncbi:MAG: tetratricopeptide repeat protein, partial [Actinomycetota bacterium]